VETTFDPNQPSAQQKIKLLEDSIACDETTAQTDPDDLIRTAILRQLRSGTQTRPVFW
jgi:hypothetical protein